MDYHLYYGTLKRICKKSQIKWVATHGLRHSTSQLYLDGGATKDDIQKLFAHSQSYITERYIHDKGSRLQQVAKVIRLFPESNFLSDVSQKFPKLEKVEESAWLLEFLILAINGIYEEKLAERERFELS